MAIYDESQVKTAVSPCIVRCEKHHHRLEVVTNDERVATRRTGSRGSSTICAAFASQVVLRIFESASTSMGSDPKTDPNTKRFGSMNSIRRRGIITWTILPHTEGIVEYEFLQWLVTRRGRRSPLGLRGLRNPTLRARSDRRHAIQSLTKTRRGCKPRLPYPLPEETVPIRSSDSDQLL